MGSAAVPWAGMFEMKITAILDSIGCLKCPVLRPSIGTTPFGGLVILAITLAWVVLQVVLVDALGLASFLPLVLSLAFALWDLSASSTAGRAPVRRPPWSRKVGLP